MVLLSLNNHNEFGRPILAILFLLVVRVSQGFAFDAAAIWHRLASLSTFSVWLYGVIPFWKEFPGGQNICWKGLTSVWCLWCHLPRWYAVIPGRTWLTWTFPTSSLSLKARGPQVYLQPLGSKLGEIQQSWLGKQSLIWLCPSATVPCQWSSSNQEPFTVGQSQWANWIF